MKKMRKEESVDLLFFLFAVFVMLVVLISNFLALRNNLTFADEGWYQCLIRDLPHTGVSRFHLFLGFFKNDIYTNRVVCWLSQILGSLVLAFGLWSWLPFYNSVSKKRGVSFLLVWGTLYFGQMSIIPVPSFFYGTMNTIIGEVAIGLFFVGLSRQKIAFFVLSGFVIAFLFPIKITNVVIIPIIYVLIFLLSPRKWKDAVGFSVGIALFFVYYFVFVESPREFMGFIVGEANKTITRGDGAYGIKWLFVWSGESLMYLAKCLFVAVVLYGSYYLLVRRNVFRLEKRWQVLVLALFSMVVLIYAWTNVSPVSKFPYKQSYMYCWHNDLFWIFSFLLLLANMLDGKMEKREKITVCFLLLCPVCLAFGSLLGLFYVGTSHFMFVAPALVFMAFKRSYLWRTGLMMALGFCFFLFVLQIYEGRNWEGQKYFGNKHIPVKTIGINQNISLEPRWIDELVSCKKKIHQGRVMCSCSTWGLVCLLGYEPICYDFAVERYDDSCFKKVVDEELDKKGSVMAVYYSHEVGFGDKLEMLKRSGDYHIESDTVRITVFSRITKEQ